GDAGGSRSGASTPADDRNETVKQGFVAEGVADLGVNTEPGQQLGEPAGIDEHVVVGLVITTPEFALTDEHRHLTPKDPVVEDRAARHEGPVISEPDPGRLFAAGSSPLEVTDVEGEYPGDLERIRHGGQRTIDVLLAVEVAQRVTDADDRIGCGQRIR